MSTPETLEKREVAFLGLAQKKTGNESNWLSGLLPECSALISRSDALFGAICAAPMRSSPMPHRPEMLGTAAQRPRTPEAAKANGTG